MARYDQPWERAESKLPEPQSAPKGKLTDYRIFVEWHDIGQPGWGGYLTSQNPQFQTYLVAMTEKYGPPTKVEFRTHTYRIVACTCRHECVDANECLNPNGVYRPQ